MELPRNTSGGKPTVSRSRIFGNWKSKMALSNKRNTSRVTSLQNSTSESNERNSIVFTKDVTDELFHLLRVKVPVHSTEYLLSLIDLDLSNNGLYDLPFSMKLLRNLQHLTLKYNKFSQMPNVVGELEHLETLNMEGNNLTKLSNNLNRLAKLLNLNVSCNKLQDLPSCCANLNQVKHLSVNNNLLKQIPSCIRNGMSNLQSLNISWNKRCTMDTPPYSTKLTVFMAQHVGISPSFPKWILYRRFNSLAEVYLDDTVFKSFDIPSCAPTCHIKKISMENCGLSKEMVEKITNKMVNLDGLTIGNSMSYLSYNTFFYMPIEQLQVAKNLSEVKVQSTGISLIPVAINSFLNMRVLDISDNKITWLPNEICDLENLEILNICNNKLIALPECIGRLTALQDFKMSSNNVPRLPNSIKNMVNLVYLDLYDNELTTVEDEIIYLPNLLGLDAELNFLSSIDLLVGNVDYECLKFALREHVGENYRMSGPKVESLPETWPRSKSYSNGTSEDHTWSNDELPSLSCKSWKSLTEENWDISEDSADEFDPNEDQKPSVERCSPLAFYSMRAEPIFCPADLHPVRTAIRIKQMLQDGTLVWPSDFEDGQFEDP